MPDEKVGPCGCVVRRDACGLWKNVYRCASHVADVARRPTGEELYRNLGAISAGSIPGHARYANELLEALPGWKPLVGPGARRALEVGAGMGMYAPWLMQNGYSYEAIEPEPWGAEWIASVFHAPVFRGSAFEYKPLRSYALIVAAHVVEHMVDAVAALCLFRSWLNLDGELVMIVLDDEDMWNPEHVWFGDERSWRGVLKEAGFHQARCATRRRIERESFLYFVASRA